MWARSADRQAKHCRLHLPSAGLVGTRPAPWLVACVCALCVPVCACYVCLLCVTRVHVHGVCAAELTGARTHMCSCYQTSSLTAPCVFFPGPDLLLRCWSLPLGWRRELQAPGTQGELLTQSHLPRQPLPVACLCESPCHLGNAVPDLPGAPVSSHPRKLTGQSSVGSSLIQMRKQAPAPSPPRPPPIPPGALWAVPPGVPFCPSRSARPQMAGTHLEQALPLAQTAPLQAPEVDVGFAAGYQQAGIDGVEGSHQHGLVGAL